MSELVSYLTFVCDTGVKNKYRPFAKYSCICGKETIVCKWDVERGHTRSCGCMHVARAGKMNYVHGLRKHPLHATWCRMKNRCYNKMTKRYQTWGGRGIEICPEWKDNFQAFYDWAIANGWEQGLQIDRIDNDGNYSPTNCRFVSAKINSNNRRSNVFEHFRGEVLTRQQLVEKYGITHAMFYSRLRKGWDLERILTTPKLIN